MLRLFLPIMVLPEHDEPLSINGGTNQDAILAAYQQKIGVKTAAASKAAASSSTIPAPNRILARVPSTESLPAVPTEAAVPPVVVVETPPPPVEASANTPTLMEQVEQVTTAAPDTICCW